MKLYIHRKFQIYIFMRRVIVSRSHKGDVYKMVNKFKPPGVVTPAGGAGYKVSLSVFS